VAGVERVVKGSGDFTADFRLVGISAIAVAIGAVCAAVALVFLRMIELFTNLFYFQEFSLRPHLPASNTLGWLAVPMPVVGGSLLA
jgi:chloride channel protein, CIC family